MYYSKNILTQQRGGPLIIDLLPYPTTFTILKHYRKLQVFGLESS